MIAELGPRRFAAEGSPADCVLAGVHDILKDTPPDLVLSGVNRGNNSAENAAYSGTLGAAMEAALQGLPAIALSQYMGPRNFNEPNMFEASQMHGTAVVRALLDNGLWDKQYGYRMFYNVNFPPVPAAEVLGTRVTSQGYRKDGAHTVVPYTAPNRRRFMWISSSPQQIETAPGTDAQSNLDGYVSITPMRADLTAHDALQTLRDRLE
jgi:5'-nucleotidase